MPNWASTLYVATGDKQQLHELHSIITELECMKEPLHPNGFGTTWLGNLVIKLGRDWNKVYCRGSWDDLTFNGEEITFHVESAWGELSEVRELIEEHFPGIKLYYQTEEPGMCIYITNDDTGEYFPDRFYLWVEDEDSEYYPSLEDLAKAVEGLTGSKHLTTLDSCGKALESFSKKHHNCCYTLEEFKILED